MPDGLPIPGDTVRQTWGKGVRSGMYPISDTELYWFTVFNAPEVHASCLGCPACIPTVTQNISAACLYAVLLVLCTCQAFVCAWSTIDNGQP